MGTRGFLGFVVEGREIIAYNHSDSYPDSLGRRVLSWLRDADIAQARRAAAKIRVVTDHTPPTRADIDTLARYYNPHVDRRDGPPTWYQLLRGTQGDPKAILEAGIVEDASAFPRDSLWAEYGYLIDFDTDVFEAYVGFQHTPHTAGRFATRPTLDDQGEYQPAALAHAWPLADLPTDQQFLHAFR